MALQLFPLLCGLSAVCFTAFTNSRSHVVYWLLGLFAFTTLLAPWFGRATGLLFVEPEQLATIVALAALYKLENENHSTAAAMFGGALMALWINALNLAGYSWSLASVFVLLVAVITILCAIYRSTFVSYEYLNEALIIVLLMAVAIAILPTAIAGWQAAAGLQGLESSQASNSQNLGVLLLVLVFVFIGIIYGKWKYR